MGMEVFLEEVRFSGLLPAEGKRTGSQDALSPDSGILASSEAM